MITPAIKSELHLYIAGIARGQGSHVHEIGGVEDHVHLFVTLPRILALSNLVEEIKKGSSKWVKSKGALYGDFSWQKGYGGFSIGQSGYDGMRTYIQNQVQHHKKESFQDEFRKLLTLYQVAYDERYVWD